MKRRVLIVLLAAFMLLTLWGCNNEEELRQEQYAEIIERLDAKDYFGAIDIITQMAAADRLNSENRPPLEEVLTGSWYTSYYEPSDGDSAQLVFNADGTCTIDGDSMTWLALETDSNVQLSLQVFEGGELRYFVYLNTSDQYMVPSLSVYGTQIIDGETHQGSHYGYFYTHEIISMMMGNWHTFGVGELEISGLYIGSQAMELLNEGYSWEVTNSENEDALTVRATGIEDDSQVYTMEITMRGEYPVMTVTDTSGDQSLFYANSFGYDEDWPEVRYARAMTALNSYRNNGYFYFDDAYYDDDNALPFLYDLFVDLGDHADSAEIVENWSEVGHVRAMRYLNAYLDRGYFYVDDVQYDDDNALPFLYDLFTELSDYAESAQIITNWSEVGHVRAMRYLNSYLEYSYFYVDDVRYDDANALPFLHDLFTELNDYAESAQILEDWDEVCYVRASRYLERYLNNGGFYVDDVYYRYNNALAYVYAQFLEIADYSEAADVLSRFTVLPQMYTGATILRTDNLGNQSTGTYAEYEFDEFGNMIYGYGPDNFQKYGISYGLDFHYDENGDLYEIQYGNVTALLTPTFDDNGNIVKIDAQYNTYALEHTFTYNDAGQLVSAVIDNYWDSEKRNFTYTYDDAGRLVQMVCEWYSGWDYVEVTTYVYDENGYLTGESLTRNRWDSWEDIFVYQYTRTITYTNDDQGRHVTAEYTSDESGYSYASEVITFTHEDLYFYDAEE